MAVDVLQDVLSTIRLRTVTEGLRILAAPWGFRTIPNDHHIAFLIIIDGGGLLELEDADPSVHLLQSGDIVVLPRGETYILRNKKHSPIWPAGTSTRCQQHHDPFHRWVLPVER